MNGITDLLASITTLHNQIREAVVAACEAASLESMSAIAQEEAGDTIYAIDRISEELLIAFFEQEIASHTPIILIAEGLAGGQVVLPVDRPKAEVRWRIIVDPFDGTRGLCTKNAASGFSPVWPPTGERKPICKILSWPYKRKFLW
jgi:fructose-1,6-bisphosphatase/inositol monophosphatase family enzyme